MILGIGTDLIEIGRIKDAFQRTKGFSEKIYTEWELEHFRDNGERIEILAGNFAAKEAFSKAIGTGFRGISPLDIEVRRDELGKPYIRLNEDICNMEGIRDISKVHVSISHCKTLASAYVVIEGEE